MDFTKASVDALLTYHAGWCAAKAGSPLDLMQEAEWIAGWNDSRAEIALKNSRTQPVALVVLESSTFKEPLPA